MFDCPSMLIMKHRLTAAEDEPGLTACRISHAEAGRPNCGWNHSVANRFPIWDIWQEEMRNSHQGQALLNQVLGIDNWIDVGIRFHGIVAAIPGCFRDVE